MCTILVPVIGYDKTAELAYEAYESNKTIRELLSEKNILSDNEIDEILIPIKMTKPSK
jgi:fumarate hydratase class II